MRQKVLKSGNSLAVSIPARFCRTLGIKPRDAVLVQADYVNGTVQYTFKFSSQPPLIKP
jgi:antitoxin component of MazEF toxin-antitoxin module